MRRKLDVSRDDLMQLREKGYSNKDIANMLEISYATVIRYIGKQECRMESVTKTPERSGITPYENPIPQVKVLRQMVAIGGYAFEVDMVDRVAYVSTPAGDGEIIIKADEIKTVYRQRAAV